MIKLLFYNFIFFIFFSFLSLIIVYEYFFASKLIENANRKYKEFKNHPEYHIDLEKVGFITHNLPPTSFITNKPDFSKIRIGCFGDSHTEGIETALGNDYPSVLQKLLGDKYQVINFGNGAYGSNQIFSLYNYYKDKYKFDYVVLGPRGFYTSRNTSFNKYWNQGSLPYSQYYLKDGGLQERVPPGKNGFERIKRYYSFFSHKDLIFHDHAPPSFLKLFFLKFRLDIKNPFYETNLKEIRNIQRNQIQDIVKSSKKVIHYTDSQKDCNEFKKIDSKKYQLYCIKRILNDFPNLAAISHPSAFGYYHHALDLFHLIKQDKIKNDYSLLKEDNSFFQSTINSSLFNKITNIGVRIDKKTIACLEENKGYGSSLGNIVSYSSNENRDHKHLFIGIYNKEKNRSGGLFLRIPFKDPVIKKLKQFQFESISNVKNIIFFGFKNIKIQHLDNQIIIKEKNNLDDDLIDILFKKERSFSRSKLKPLFPTFKMTVKPDIDAFSIMTNLKSNKSLTISMTNDCKSSNTNSTIN